MNEEDQINWVTLTLNFTPEQEAKLLERAQAVGLSPKCYVVNLLLRHLLEDATAIQREQWQRDFPATLRRNGCEESSTLS
jgi:hypothetical protein